MTAPTPEQMRALAAHHLSDVDYYGYSTGSLSAKTAAALRAAADQLDAVRKWAEGTVQNVDKRLRDFDNGYDAAGSDVLRILTADTAPQEDRDE